MAPLLNEQQIDIVFGTLDGVVAATRTLAQQLFCSFAVRRKGIRVITSALAQFLDVRTQSCHCRCCTPHRVHDDARRAHAQGHVSCE